MIAETSILIASRRSGGRPEVVTCRRLRMLDC